jgi:hypothetical protein
VDFTNPPGVTVWDASARHNDEQLISSQQQAPACHLGPNDDNVQYTTPQTFLHSLPNDLNETSSTESLDIALAPNQLNLVTKYGRAGDSEVGAPLLWPDAFLAPRSRHEASRPLEPTKGPPSPSCAEMDCFRTHGSVSCLISGPWTAAYISLD